MIALSMAAVIGLALGFGFFAARDRARAIEAAHPPQGRFVEAGPWRLHVVERGRSDAPPVILIHGATANARDILGALEDELAADHRVIAFDRPGLGHSSPLGRPDRLAGHADAVAALITALDLDRPVVVGHSYGGSVALRTALDHPDQIAGAVLLGAPSYGFVGPVAWYNHVPGIPVIGPLFTRIAIPLVGPANARVGAPGAFAPQPMPEGYVERIGLDLLFRPATFRENAADLAVVNPELAAQEARYASLAVPIVLIAGARDTVVSTERHSERLAAVAPRARLAVLPGVGHKPEYADPELVGAHVRALRTGADGAHRAEGPFTAR